MKISKTLRFGLLMLAVTIAIVIVGAVVFSRQYEKEPVYPGPGVTRITMLSEYYPKLKGSAGDTEVYIMDSGEPGGTFLIFGGTHGPELSGVMAAFLVVENVVVSSGRLIVIPHVNESGYTWCEPGQGHPDRIEIATADGSVRWFRSGSRATNPVHQWPDPEMYIHYPSGQKLAADEARNFNRNHPGKDNGTLTQKVAYAVQQLINQENVDMVLDQHEAPPEKPLVDAVCAHQDAVDLVTWASMYLEEEGIEMRIEASPINLHGFSHREIGDHTDALAILSETSNSHQGAVHGKITAETAVNGQDKFYDRLRVNGNLAVKWNEFGEPLDYRTGRNLSMINQLANAYSDLYPDNPIYLDNVPTLTDLMENGIGAYLHPLV